MSFDWVAPAATALVGIIGIAGTVYSGRLQRITQLESVAQQKSLEAEASARAQKQVAFVEFWNAHQAFQHALRGRSTNSHPDTKQVAEAYSRLYAARNNVALLSSMYTMYYMDEIMGDAQRLMERTSSEGSEARFPEAPHYTYYLMRAEISGEDLNSKGAGEVLKALQDNSAKQQEIAKTLSAQSGNSA